MAQLPQCTQQGPYTRDGQLVRTRLSEFGWHLESQGKVRDTYRNFASPGMLCSVATDRLSIFDFVLPAQVTGKGEVLTALTHFWLTSIFTDVRNHLLIGDSEQGFPLERALLVQKVPILPFELIFRKHLGGSVWKEYHMQGTAAGQTLPPNLTRWQRFEWPLFTPSTKAEVGHDENVTVESFMAQMGAEGTQCVELLQGVYQRAYQYAESRGMLILDTKFEGGGRPFVLADEVLTPDSSRFTSVKSFEEASREGKDPTFFDKEVVRQWGRQLPTPFGVTGIHELKPENPAHLEFVHTKVQVPQEILAETARRYQQLFTMLVGVSLNEYQATAMGIEG